MGKSHSRAEKTESLKSLALILVIGLSLFTTVASMCGNVAVHATSETFNLSTIEYTVPGIYTVQVCDLRATIEAPILPPPYNLPWKIRVQGTIKFSASSWNTPYRGVLVNIALVASRSNQLTKPSYSAYRSGGDVPDMAILYICTPEGGDPEFDNLWYSCTGRVVELGTMWTEIHPDAQGCELATGWNFWPSGGNVQQRIFDCTLEFTDVDMTRLFLCAGVVDKFDWENGVVKKVLNDIISKWLGLVPGIPSGTGGLVGLIEAVEDLILIATGEKRGNIDAVWIVPVGESVEAEELTWTAGGNEIPQRTTKGGESIKGGDAIRLGDFDYKKLQNNEQTWISTTVTGPGTLSFYWKVSSEYRFDYLRFYIDGVQQAKISGSVDWQQQIFSIGSGSHTLKWTYTKDYSVSQGSDCGWVDWVEWTTSYLSGGLLGKYYGNKDLTDYTFHRVDPTVDFDWGSGSPDSRVDSNTFSVTWTGKIRIDRQGTYWFYVKTDDGSRLWIDGMLLIDKWKDQGAREYATVVTLSPGYHDIRYEYYENGGLAVAKLMWYSSSPYIPKQVIPSSNLYYSLPAFTDLGVAVERSWTSWTTGGDGYWFGQTVTQWTGGDAAQSSAILHNQQTYMQTTVTGPGKLRFYWKVSSEGYYDYLRFYIDGVQQLAISGSVDWQQQIFSIGSGSHTLKWAYTKDYSVNKRSDCGWVDWFIFPYSGGGPPGPCPTLFVWNGTQYVEEGVIDDHASEDVTVQWTIHHTPVPDGDFYKLMLRELDSFTTHIDCVKLYAVDAEGKWQKIPLVKATHSELGNVKQQLLLNDATRVDITPTQTIELKFPVLDIQVAYFIFEIDSHNMK